jgi:hypothetical protein
LLVIAFVGNLLDDSFPSLKTHRYSFLEFGPPYGQPYFVPTSTTCPCFESGQRSEDSLKRYCFQFDVCEAEGALILDNIASFTQVASKMTTVRTVRAGKGRKRACIVRAPGTNCDSFALNVLAEPRSQLLTARRNHRLLAGFNFIRGQRAVGGAVAQGDDVRLLVGVDLFAAVWAAEANVGEERAGGRPVDR